MKNTYYTLLATAGLLVGFINESRSQDALLMQDINFYEFGYNTAFIANNDQPLGISLTNTNGGGIQQTGQINFIGYSHVGNTGLSLGTRVNAKYFGLFRTSSVELLGAQRIALSEHSRLMAGISLGMHFHSLRTGELNGNVDRNDPMLQDNTFPQYRFAFGLGLAYVWKDKLRAGLSIPAAGRTESEFDPGFISNVSYDVALTEVFDMRPEVLVFGTGNTPITGEMSARVRYKEQFWVRFGGRSTGTLVGSLGIDVGAISVGYAYNAYFGDFRDIVPTVHHINLTYLIKRVNEEEIEAP